jgi:hypothetical protein
MDAEKWVATLTDAELERLESVICAERLTRARNALNGQTHAAPDDAMGQEVDRLIAVRDARRAEAARQYHQYVIGAMERRRQMFEEGRLGMCSCRACLTAYVQLDRSLLCPTGEWQFKQDASWSPWTA